MIDYTNIQLNPIPPTIISLQKANTGLKTENNVYRNVYIIIGLSTAVLIAYILYKNIQKEKEHSKDSNNDSL